MANIIKTNLLVMVMVLFINVTTMTTKVVTMTTKVVTEVVDVDINSKEYADIFELCVLYTRYFKELPELGAFDVMLGNTNCDTIMRKAVAYVTNNNDDTCNTNEIKRVYKIALKCVFVNDLVDRNGIKTIEELHKKIRDMFLFNGVTVNNQCKNELTDIIKEYSKNVLTIKKATKDIQVNGRIKFLLNEYLKKDRYTRNKNVSKLINDISNNGVSLKDANDIVYKLVDLLDAEQAMLGASKTKVIETVYEHDSYAKLENAYNLINKEMNIILRDMKSETDEYSYSSLNKKWDKLNSIKKEIMKLKWKALF